MQVVVTEFLSLDGVMEEPQWTFEFRAADSTRFKYDELFAADALLLGRVTYEGFAAAWPTMNNDDFGRRMNTIPKYVVSSTLAHADASWGPVTVLRGDIVTEVQALREQAGGELLVEGSAQLVQALIQHDLVDRYHLMLFPLIVGAGKRLFAEHMPAPARLRLTSARTVGQGIVLLTLERPAG